ncbi:MAG: hypothetical protein P4L83_10685, partial [Nevskia sp.]|nr:hypothetical protein [Nevskia sp.]
MVTATSINGDGILLQPTCTGMDDAGTGVQPAQSFFPGGSTTAQMFTFVAGNIPSLIACTFTGLAVDANGDFVTITSTSGLDAPTAQPDRTLCDTGVPSTQCSLGQYARPLRLVPTSRCNCFYAYCDQEASYPSYPDQALDSADITTSDECATQCMGVTTGGGHGYYGSWFGWRGEFPVGTPNPCQLAAGTAVEVPVPPTLATFTAALALPAGAVGPISPGATLILTVTPVALDGDGITLTPTCTGITGSVTPPLLFFRGAQTAPQTFTMVAGDQPPSAISCTFTNQYVDATGGYQSMTLGFEAQTARAVPQATTQATFTTTISSAATLVSGSTVTVTVTATSINGDGILLQPTCTGMAAGASVQPAQSFFLGEATTAQTFTFAAGATPSAISCTFTNQYVDASGSVQVLASGFFIAPPVHTLPQATTQATFSTALLPAAAKDIVSGSTVTLTVTPSSIDGDGVILQPTCTGMADGSNVQPAMSFFLGGASTAQTFTFVAGNIPSLLACTFTGETVDAAGVWQAMSTGLTAPDAVPARTSCGSGAPSTQCSSSLYARSTRLQPTIRCNCFYSYCDQEASYPSYPDQALNSADITTSGECATQCMALTTGGGHGYYASWFGWRGEVEVGTKGACQADSDREVPVPTTQATFTTVLPHLDTIEANQPVTLTLTPTSIDGDGVTVTPTCFGLSSGGITPTSIFFRGGGLATAQNFTLAVGATPADLQCTFEGKVVSAAGVFQPMITGFNAPTAVPVVPVITLKVTPITVTSVVPSIAPRPLTWRVGLTGANVLTQGDTTTVTVQCASGQVACAKADASSSSASSSIDCASAAASRTCSYTFDASSSALAPG